MAAIGSNPDLLTPVDTTFKRMYLVSQDVFDEFKQFRDNGNGPPPPPDHNSSAPPPGPPSGRPPGPPPGPPFGPQSELQSNPQINLEEPGPAFPPTVDNTPRPGPSTQVQCMRKLRNGKPCNKIFDDRDQLNIHERAVHDNNLSQAAIQNTANLVDASMHNSIDNNSRLSSSVREASHQDITDTPMVEADVTQCRVCSFRGNSPEDLDQHMQNDHLDYASLSRKMLRPRVMLKRLMRKQLLRGLQPRVNLERLSPRSIPPLNSTVEDDKNPKPETSQQATTSMPRKLYPKVMLKRLTEKELLSGRQPRVNLKRLTEKELLPRQQPRVNLERLTENELLQGRHPRVNLERLTPRSIPLNTVESYENPYENPRPGTSRQAMASDSIPSPRRTRRRKRAAANNNTDDKPPASRDSIPSPRRTRSQKRAAANNNTNDRPPASRPRVSRTPDSRPRASRQTVPSSPAAATPSPRKRNADIQRATIELDPSTEQQRKNAFDLAMRVKRRKTTHVKQSDTVDNTGKKKKKKKKKQQPKKRGRTSIIDRYKHKRRNVHPIVQRNVAALGLAGY